MPEAKRRVAIAMGVSDAPPLPYLAGAVNGARGFHDWAQAMGYESRLLVDDAGAVTFDRLRQELDGLLAPGGAPIHRLLLYFAGHGLIREAEEGLWLLSDWYSELRAVAVEVLRRRLYMHGIRQIGIFADACRSLPADINAADLTADGILGRGPVRVQGSPAIDKFIAAQDGTETFMVPGASPSDDRCIFSGVLLEGLWGTKPSAFSTLVPGKITSSSLGRYLQAEVSAVAQRYAYSVIPTVVPAFPEDDNTYYGDGTPPPAPTFPPWPAPGFPKKSQGVGGGLEAVVGVRTPPGPPTVPAAAPLQDRLRDLQRPDHFETGAGFAVEGAAVTAFWTAPDLFAEPHGRGRNWWRVGQRQGFRLQRPAPVLIELDGRLFVAVTALPEFIGSVVCDSRGAAGLVYRQIGLPDAGVRAGDALGQMDAGGLRADAVADFAIELRHHKHSDPVLGVLSAYLYDSIGDIDNIRRTAWFYQDHHQPIPYDVALLAQLTGRLGNHVLHASIPAVPKREPRTDKERRFAWTYDAMPAAEGVVGGFWPMMRQGWTYLDDPSDDGSSLVLPGIVELIPSLTPARFATLDARGGEKLANLFGLVRRDHP